MKRPREHNETHLAFIRSLPSLVRGNGPIEAAHLRYAEAAIGKPITGMAEKPHDCWTVPLCASAHREQHAGSERAFWQRQGINPLIIAALLFVHSGDEKAATTVVRNARSIAPWSIAA